MFCSPDLYFIQNSYKYIYYKDYYSLSQRQRIINSGCSVLGVYLISKSHLVVGHFAAALFGVIHLV